MKAQFTQLSMDLARSSKNACSLGPGPSLDTKLSATFAVVLISLGVRKGAAVVTNLDMVDSSLGTGNRLTSACLLRVVPSGVG